MIYLSTIHDKLMSLFSGYSIRADVQEVQPNLWALRGDHVSNGCGLRHCRKVVDAVVTCKT
jgi:hypothetical protein